MLALTLYVTKDWSNNLRFSPSGRKLKQGAQLDISLHRKKGKRNPLDGLCLSMVWNTLPMHIKRNDLEKRVTKVWHILKKDSTKKKIPLVKYKEIIVLCLEFLWDFIIKMRTRTSHFGEGPIYFKMLLIFKSLSNDSNINLDYFKLHKWNVILYGKAVFINTQSLLTVFFKYQHGIWSPA